MHCFMVLPASRNVKTSIVWFRPVVDHDLHYVEIVFRSGQVQGRSSNFICSMGRCTSLQESID
jgi:hypothetical protein